MEISLRSQMAAGIAVAGAAAIAVTPIVQPDVLPSLDRVGAAVQLNALVNPLEALGESLGVLGNSLFGTLPGVPLPLGETGASVLSPQGLLPQLLNGSKIVATLSPSTVLGNVSGTPLLSAVGTNASKYATAGINSLAALSTATGALVFGLPITAIEVVDALINGDPIDIGQIIEDAIITPITSAFETVVDQTAYIIESVIDNVVELVSAVPTLVTGVFQQALGSAVFLGTQTLNTVVGAVEALASLDLEAAWNGTVNGLIGPSGVLSNAVKLSLGNGVITGDVETPFIPSLKQVLTVGTVGASQLIPAPPVPPAAARSVAPAAAAAAEVEAPAEISASDVKVDVSADAPSVAATVADNDAAPQAGDGDKASAPKASKQRATRKAASE